jgi:hypothetical protein
MQTPVLDGDSRSGGDCVEQLTLVVQSGVVHEGCNRTTLAVDERHSPILVGLRQRDSPSAQIRVRRELGQPVHEL